jgi:hypothetical protein
VVPLTEKETSVLSEVEKLNDKTRLVVTLRYGHQISIPEISQIIGIRISNVHEYLCKFRKTLFIHLTPKVLQDKPHGDLHRIELRLLQLLFDDIFEEDPHIRRKQNNNLKSCTRCKLYKDSLQRLEESITRALFKCWPPVSFIPTDTKLIISQIHSLRNKQKRLAPIMKLDQETIIFGVLFLAALAVGVYITRQETQKARPISYPSLPPTSHFRKNVPTASSEVSEKGVRIFAPMPTGTPTAVTASSAPVKSIPGLYQADGGERHYIDFQNPGLSSDGR